MLMFQWDQLQFKCLNICIKMMISKMNQSTEMMVL